MFISDPGSRILMLTFSHPGSPIPDPGVKKVPNPGSRIPDPQHCQFLVHKTTYAPMIYTALRVRFLMWADR
jgi:hypothetical protein